VSVGIVHLFQERTDLEETLPFSEMFPQSVIEHGHDVGLRRKLADLAEGVAALCPGKTCCSHHFRRADDLPNESLFSNSTLRRTAPPLMPVVCCCALDVDNQWPFESPWHG
jgi:hypothetical protein